MKTPDEKAQAIHELLVKLDYPFTLKDVENYIQGMSEGEPCLGEVGRVIHAVMAMRC
jgi:hypothetical protein